MATLVAYNIPGRDLGNYSRGGAENAASYKDWIKRLAALLPRFDSLIVLEPDALAHIANIDNAFGTERSHLLRFAVEVLRMTGRTRVYVDAGHPRWRSSEEIYTRINRSGLLDADGFALNVSNFVTTDENVRYGKELCERSGMHFVIDISRNGRGPAIRSDGSLEWCNPPGRALGSPPTTDTGHAMVDALLWIKRPGESDGECNGGPPAGHWWPDYALGLARRASWR